MSDRVDRHSKKTSKRKIIIIIRVFIEIKLTIATCYNDTPNKLPRRTALHCITEHKTGLQVNQIYNTSLARSFRLPLSARYVHNAVT